MAEQSKTGLFLELAMPDKTGVMILKGRYAKSANIPTGAGIQKI